MYQLSFSFYCPPGAFCRQDIDETPPTTLYALEDWELLAKAEVYMYMQRRFPVVCCLLEGGGTLLLLALVMSILTCAVVLFETDGTVLQSRLTFERALYDLVLEVEWGLDRRSALFVGRGWVGGRSHTYRGGVCCMFPC